MVLKQGQDGIKSITSSALDHFERIIISPEMNVLNLSFNQTNYTPKSGETSIFFNNYKIEFNSYKEAELIFSKIEELFN